ncbi:MAG: right-handed parallel beta-helix repeat-containing protein [Gorillibacterium sp.]|nr:right-handed parallel beta-helix repeat-containing protein [Gorillibacterium sp.]
MKVSDYYISPQGNDGNAGSKEQPFMTVARAQMAVRASIIDGMTEDRTVYLYSGDYEQRETLRFDDRDSGRDGFQVVYRNVSGEKPVLLGGRKITGWEKHDAAIWKTRVAAGASFQTLYADGERVNKARLPVTGYFRTDEIAVGLEEGATNGGIRYRNGDIPEHVDLHHAQAFVWPGEGEWNWISETKLIKEIDRETRSLLFDHPSSWGIGAGSRYYIQGSLGLLQSPGQFHLDEAEGILYYWPQSGSPNQQTITIPSVTRLLEIKGRDKEQRVQSLTFSGLSLMDTDFTREYRMMNDNDEREEHREGLVYMDNAEAITLSSCQITNSGSCGIFLDRYVRDIVIDNNVLERLGYVGIYASGFSPGKGEFTTAEASNTNRGHKITNNRIVHGGELVGHGCGILLFQSGDNDISHNYISAMPRYGISMKGLRYGGMPDSLYGIPVTWDNHWDFLHTRGNQIAYNDISQVMTDSQDGGLIEAWGPGRGNIIHSNHLHHSGIHFSFGFGIYLDDACDDFTVTNNVLNDLYSTGEGKLWMLIFSKGIGNRIYNNLLANNPQSISAIGTQEMVGEANREVDIARNLVYDSGYLYYFVNWDEARFKAADHNLYWRKGEPCRVAGEISPLTPRGSDILQRNEYDWAQWRSLQDGKYDSATIFADPLFQDVEARDYRLQPGSPVYPLGWTDIEFEKIGPIEDE